MTFFGRLQRKSGTLGYIKLEITGRVGFVGLLAVHHRLSVDQEMSIANRYGAILIEYSTAEAHTGDIIEIYVAHYTPVVRKTYGGGGRGGVVVSELRRLAGRGDGILHAVEIEQTVEQEIAARVRNDALYRLAIIDSRGRYRYTRATGAVFIVHIAAYLTVDETGAQGFSR